ncbi:MAG: hypothetical protein CM1200mP26_01660 [Acidimicrobiales bacterium]|nr:MAG: hypothetical protein CM1200mP26_01660 [Acidimicrobiales bacterium]
MTRVGRRLTAASCVAVPAVFLAVFFLYPVGSILARGLWVPTACPA